MNFRSSKEHGEKDKVLYTGALGIAPSDIHEKSMQLGPLLPSDSNSKTPHDSRGSAGIASDALGSQSETIIRSKTTKAYAEEIHKSCPGQPYKYKIATLHLT